MLRIINWRLRVPITLVLGWAALSYAAFADQRPHRPNIVLIYADDWRWDCLGVVQREQGDKARFPWLETPRLDRLAGQSVRFQQAFVINSLCSPGRAAVLTGRYSHANGIIGNSQPFPTDTPTFATRLQQAGYKTAYCGKWHMDGQRERPGFEFVASFVGQGRYFDCPVLLNGEQTQTSGWIDDVSTDYAVQFLEQQTNDKPFFLFLGFKSPHGPRGGKNLPKRVSKMYADEQSRDSPNVDVPAVYRRGFTPDDSFSPRRPERRFEGHRDYMRHITAIDECIGRVLDALDDTGLAANTLLIVTSDNGYYLGEHGLSDKRTAYEESIRVPLLVRLPGENSNPGRAIDEAMVLNVDLAPTILDFAQAKSLPGVHGRSLRPLLEGQTPPNWRQAFLYEYFLERQYAAAAPTVLAVRSATHKLITYPGHDDWTEVFDLQSDPYETENLVADQSLLAKLRRVFDREARAVDFQMPPDVTDSDERPRRRERRRRPRQPERSGEL